MPREFKVVGLAAGNKWQELARQAVDFAPQAVAIGGDHVDDLRESLDSSCTVLSGPRGLEELAVLDEADIVLNGIVGAAGVEPTISAVAEGKRLALANKESLVCAGDLVMRQARDRGATLVPVDSEHSAVQQCLIGERPESIRRLIMTASGGPFWGMSSEAKQAITPEQALDHPRWKMGRRITVDSATLANKAFEVLEASHLFGVPLDRVSVVVHPQAAVHSMVEFIDGNVKAQIGPADMRLPILYALGYPQRLESHLTGMEIRGEWRFEPLEPDRWPAFQAVIRAGEIGGSAGAAVNAADEELVGLFLKRGIGFTAIGGILTRIVEDHQPWPVEDVEAFRAADTWGRQRALELARAPGPV